MYGLSMLDLFSGSGSASRAAEVRGWRVFRIDNAPDSNADLKVDLRCWSPIDVYFDLVWASPPCNLLTTARTKGRDVKKGIELVERSVEIIRQLKPRWWVIENVHGATRAISMILGPPVERYGSFYLWGCFPPFEALVKRDKTKMVGRRRSEKRARIPWAISYGLVTACERMHAELSRVELGSISVPAGVPAKPTSGTRDTPEVSPSAAPRSPEVDL